MKAILPIIGFAASAGVSPPVLLRAAGLDPALVADPGASLLYSQELRLWEEAVHLTGDEDFGLHLGEWVARCPEEHFDVLVFATRSCATLGEQYRRAGRYMRLIHDGIYLSLEEDGGLARLVHGHHPERVGPRHPVEGMLTIAVLNGRRAIGEEFVPRAVCFRHARPSGVSEQERVFKAPVHYGCARNEVVLDGALLARPQRHAEPRLLAVLERQLDGLMSELPEGGRFRDVVERCMREELPDREPTIAAIAARLRMSPRSLQRRLQGEGTSCAAVLSDLRHHLALRYLKDPRIAIGEVGFLLGFLDVSAFHRAFKRWTGSTPAEYQRSVRGGS